MLTKEAGERIVHARWIAGAVFDLVSDLVTMNGMEPMAALESIHQTEPYARLWYDDVWTYPHWAIYEEFCRRKESKPVLLFDNGTTQKWT